MATRKTTSAKVSKTTKPVAKSSQKVETTTSGKTTSLKNRIKLPALKVRKAYIIGGLVVIILLALLVYFRSLFVVATVNGQPVTRLNYIKELEQVSGQQALNTLVTKTLILQEAKSKNVTVSDQEVNDEIKKIEESLATQGQQLDSVLQLQGMTKESLREQIYLQKLIEKMVGSDVNVTDKEVDDYIAQNQESLPEGTDAAAMKTQVKEQLQQQKLNEQVQTWLQNLQQSADVKYWIKQ